MTTGPMITPEAATAPAPQRPPGSRIVVLQDDSGLTIVIPPRMGRGALLWFVMSGVCFLFAFLYLGVYLAAALKFATFVAAPNAVLPWLVAVGPILPGVSMLLQAMLTLKRWTYFTVQGDELEVRQAGLVRESRVRWPRGKIGRIFVEHLWGTATLCIRVVGVDYPTFAGASPAEWDWVAALLRQALNQTEGPPRPAAADCNSAVDEITSSPNQVRRS
jgi:hypothetical protein